MRNEFSWGEFGLGFILAWVVAAIIFGALARNSVTPDLRREQAKRDAWRLYMEASK